MNPSETAIAEKKLADLGATTLESVTSLFAEQNSNF